MFTAIKTFFSPAPYQAEAHNVYVSLVTQARRPFFYTEGAVADTLDGRFDVIALHLFLVIHRLRREPSLEAGEFARALQEVFFSDMDRSVREMGVSDTGVGKRVKQMAQAFYGRLQAYEQAVANPQAFKECLKRNLYRDTSISQDALRAVADYCARTMESLKAQNADTLLRGELNFS